MGHYLKHNFYVDRFKPYEMKRHAQTGMSGGSAPKMSNTAKAASGGNDGGSESNGGGGDASRALVQELNMKLDLKPNRITMTFNKVVWQECNQNQLLYNPLQVFPFYFFNGESKRRHDAVFNFATVFKIKSATAKMTHLMCLQDVASTVSAELTTSAFSQNGYMIKYCPKPRTSRFQLTNWPIPDAGPTQVALYTPLQTVSNDNITLFDVAPGLGTFDAENLALLEVDSGETGDNGTAHTGVGNVVKIAVDTGVAIAGDTNLHHRGETSFVSVGEEVNLSPNIGKQFWYPCNTANQFTEQPTADLFSTFQTTLAPPIGNKYGVTLQTGGSDEILTLHKNTPEFNTQFFAMAPVKTADGGPIGLRMSFVIKSEMVMEFIYDDYANITEDPVNEGIFNYHQDFAFRKHWRKRMRYCPKVDVSSVTDETAYFLAA